MRATHLVRITHDEGVAVRTRHSPHQTILQPIRVLELIHQQVFTAARHHRSDGRHGFQQFNTLHQHVIKVQLAATGTSHYIREARQMLTRTDIIISKSETRTRNKQQLDMFHTRMKNMSNHTIT